jgi:hypothetical protein
MTNLIVKSTTLILSKQWCLLNAFGQQNKYKFAKSATKINGLFSLRVVCTRHSNEAIQPSQDKRDLPAEGERQKIRQDQN